MKIAVKCMPCPSCKVQGRVEVEESDFYDWKGGKFVQDAFPYLSPDQREMLITGYDKECWEDLFMYLESDL